MIILDDKTNCSGCHACANACPKNCISMVSDEEGFWYPQVNKEKCIDCGLCEKVCPIIHKWQPDDSRKTTAIAAINLNEEIRLESSSGGIFTLIAEKIIDQGGVVFGAAFSDDFKSVRHICVDNKADLEKLRGSKYVQSKISDTYKHAKEYLDSGRKVLFSGTPCQIGGLYSYLRKPYENLLTQDIICHGVPSPMVWEKYVEKRERKAASEMQRVFFRHKKYGWKSFSMAIEFTNHTKYIRTLLEDPYMRLFLSNSCLRPSCYSCSFKTESRQADISLADFWGVQYTAPKMDDDKGTSLVIIHSEKGVNLIKSISPFIVSQEIDMDVVLRYNPALIQSASKNAHREAVFARISSYDIEDIVNDLFPIKLKSKVKSVLSKIGISNSLIKIKTIMIRRLKRS
ncbi:Coenzyme F420 hydrogenase/dehydrogenase, beta subunit C-terminal domain [Ruminococcus flavefaciens]|uniref:Coenzyme F420 hydrogenase/dehydrogenase, beta subunit C-terminal domain n=1 Tax=Ruminococcus flavefaciens TaxID=1265 RepID=UPI0026EA8E90|nr:Coenzyme F420 hydrogenase/dehydrogenase, beta subunit C-terminal domain [Ruminococcus flavefaciens]